MLKATKENIQAILSKCIDGALHRTKENISYRPFHEALLTNGIVDEKTNLVNEWYFCLIFAKKYKSILHGK
ncbi:MAG: hypothetical protein MUC59_17060 [Saprospiraceae bacterium]|nr:hypothetical protein [Saprospiraceae bacterium]